MSTEPFDPSDLIDNEEDVINIDTAVIDDNSLKEAEGLIENLKDIYTDPSFLKDNPKFATRLKSEIEDLRILIKVRKSDETVHDILLGSIGKNPNNASLFRALTEVQKTILSTTTDISEKIKDINALLKNAQLEINFKGETNTEEEPKTQTPSTFRGSKDFIKQMRMDLEKENQNDDEDE